MNETKLQNAIASYLKLQYPEVVFTSESSGVRTSYGMAKRLKAQRSVHRLPDLIILECRGGFAGLLIELKVSSPYKKDGTLKAGRAYEQNKTLELLRKKGYSAHFGVGFEHTKKIIDDYLQT